MGIIKKEERQRMSDTIVSQLEDSGYKIGEAKENKIMILPKKGDPQKRLHLFLHNQKVNYNNFRDEVNGLLYNGHYVANIFYKDGENFHVRLGGKTKVKGDGRSLKKYTENDLRNMLHLRKLEKIVLKYNNPKKILNYYQPETQKLTEGFRSYSMEDVRLDYSHILPNNRKFDFVIDRVSDDYKVASEITREGRSFGFYPKAKNSKVLLVNPPKYIASKR